MMLILTVEAVGKEPHAGYMGFIYLVGIIGVAWMTLYALAK